MVVSIGGSSLFYGLATHTWKRPNENSRVTYVTYTLRTRTGYAHMETAKRKFTYDIRHVYATHTDWLRTHGNGQTKIHV